MSQSAVIKPLLILKTGRTIPAIAQRLGDFEQWFQAALGSPVAVEIIDATQVSTLPDPNQYCGMIITGSPAMVSHREPWSEATAAWLRQAFEQDIPMLGVCYGHQLIAHALGGQVGPNPYGRHIGCAELQLTEHGQCDPLVAILDAAPRVQVTHMERVLVPPPGAQVLATTAADPYHALRFGPHAWGLQFHPEFDEVIMRAYVTERQENIDLENLNSQAILDTIQPTPQARQIISEFAQWCQQAAQPPVHTAISV